MCQIHFLILLICLYLPFEVLKRFHFMLFTLLFDQLFRTATF